MLRACSSAAVMAWSLKLSKFCNPPGRTIWESSDAGSPESPKTSPGKPSTPARNFGSVKKSMKSWADTDLSTTFSPIACAAAW